MQGRRLALGGLLPALLLAFTHAPSAFARVEAVEGKVYTLTRQHGPWMIMVASFHTTGADGETEEGKSPEEAANELVLELRRRGVPAYVYAIETGGEFVVTRDRAGREVRRKTLRRVRSIGVLAGNYPGIDDDIGQRTLQWIKNYDPQCLKEGVVFRPTETRPTPLAGAFLTINPLLTPEEVAQQQIDPLLVRLNSGEDYSLLENRGTYTLVVARFAGKTVTQGLTFGRSHSEDFLADNDLDDAAEQARQLTVALRQAENVEAFVWHDRYESIVTVGGFSSPQDPRIAMLRQRFGATTNVDPLLPRNYGSSEVQILAVDAAGNKVDITNVGRAGLTRNYRIWAFDPNPQLMRVPRAR